MAIFLLLLSLSLEDGWLSLELEFQKHLSSIIRFYRLVFFSITILFASPR